MFRRPGITLVAVLLALTCGLGVPAHVVFGHALWHAHDHGALDSHSHPHNHGHGAEHHDHDHEHGAKASGQDHDSAGCPDSWLPHRHGHPPAHEHSNDGSHDHDILQYRLVVNRIDAPLPSIAAFVGSEWWILPDSVVSPPEQPDALPPEREFITFFYRRGPPRA